MLAFNLKPKKNSFRAFQVTLLTLLFLVGVGLLKESEKQIGSVELVLPVLYFDQSLVNFLSELIYLITPGVVLEKMSAEQDEVILDGRAETDHLIALWLEELQKLNMLLSVKLIEQHRLESSWQFRLVVILRPLAEKNCATLSITSTLREEINIYELQVMDQQLDRDYISWSMIGAYPAIVEFLFHLICHPDWILHRLSLSPTPKAVRAELWLEQVNIDTP